MSIPATFCDYLPSPWGLLEVQASSTHVLAVKFVSDYLQTPKPNEISTITIQQLSEYATGERLKFTLPLGATGTLFQQQVWQQLVNIPYAGTCSYGDIAQAISKPKAVRAVGAANGRNPITIIVPCHRVIGANGSLTGYAWGTEIKAALLQHEQRFVQKN